MTVNIFEKHSETDFHYKTCWNGTFPKHEKNETHVFKRGEGPRPSVERVLAEFRTERKLMKIIVFGSFEARNGMELNEILYLAK